MLLAWPARFLDTDPTLAAGMAAGDEHALRKLYDQLGGRVRALALRVLGNAAEADDVLQETFVHVWQRAEQFDPGRGSMSAWVSTIAHHRAVDRLRRRGTRPMAELSASEVEVVRGADLEEVEQRQARGRIQQALAELPPEQREAIELMYFAGLSQREVSDRLGVALGTVKSRVRAGMQRLSGLLEGFAPEVRP